MTEFHFTKKAMIAIHAAAEDFICDWMKDKLPKEWVRGEFADLPSYFEDDGVKYDPEKTSTVIHRNKTVNKKGCWVLNDEDEDGDENGHRDGKGGRSL